MFSKLFERRSSPENPATSLANPDSWLYQALGADRSTSGVGVSETSALGLVSVFSCINILSSAMGQLPCNLIQFSEKEKHHATKHPVYDLLRVKPNNDMTAFTFFQTMMASVAGWGNGYALINWNRLQYPAQLLPLSSATTIPKRVDGLLMYELNGPDNRRITVPARDILHVKGMSYDGLVGLSPIRLARETVGAGLSAQKFQNQFYYNGATPSGVLTFPGKIMEPTKLRDEWQASQSGENRGKVAVLENGMKYEKISIDPVDAQYVETASLTATQIASIFRVPPHMINVLDRATWGNVESLGLEFVVHTLGSWFIAWQQELELKLLSDRERGHLQIRFDPRALMKGDHKSRSIYYKGSIVDGWMTRNEVRELEDLNPLEGLDEPLQPLNMAAASLAEEIQTKPAAAPANPNAKPKADQSADPAARAAFRAVVERLYQREKRQIEDLVNRCKHVTPDVFHRESARMIRDDLGYIQQMFGCSDEAVARYRDSRVFALAGMDRVKSVHDWLHDEAARVAEIEEVFRD